MGARITLTVDEKTKSQVIPILDDFGMDMSTAANILFKTIVKERRFPIDIVASAPKQNAFDMSPDELTNRFSEAVKNRGEIKDPEYTMMMDISEKKPYKLYADGRREYLDE